MSIVDAIKNSVLEQFSQSISVSMILCSLVVAFLISLFIVLVYKKTFSGIVFNKSSVLTIIMLAMTTAMIIRTINSNLSLSLGMVGALSIVRFRTAIKDPVDTSFMFWAITAGIMSGAGLYVVAAVGSLCVGLLFYIVYLMDVKARAQYLLVVIYNAVAEEEVKSVLETIKKKNLKSRSANAAGTLELTFEVTYGNDVDQAITSLQAINGIKTVNLVTYTNDYGL